VGRHFHVRILRRRSAFSQPPTSLLGLYPRRPLRLEAVRYPLQPESVRVSNECIIVDQLEDQRCKPGRTPEAQATEEAQNSRTFATLSLG
jgi:hypothetical protein